LALHVAAIVAVDDRAVKIDYQQQALELAVSSGAALIEGFARVSLATLEAQADPISGAKRYVDVMAHYLRVGNHAHLRSFGRALIVPLVDCRAYEPAATIEAATRNDAVLVSAGATTVNAIARARAQLGHAYATAATRGEKMSDDELVRYLESVVADL